MLFCTYIYDFIYDICYIIIPNSYMFNLREIFLYIYTTRQSIANQFRQ